jgi:AraC-like DNA-binding protein
VVFSVFLFIRKAKNISNYILGLQLFSQAAGIFAGFCFNQYDFFYNNCPHLIFTGYPFMYLWGPTFYLYVKSASYTDFKLKPALILHFIPFLVIFAYLLFTFYPLGADAKRLVLSNHSILLYSFLQYLDMFIRAQVLFYIIKSILVLHSIRNKLKESYSSIPKTNLSWIRFLVFGFIISYVLTVPFITVFSYFFGIVTDLMKLAIITPYFIYFNVIFYRAWYQSEIFAGVEENIKYKSSKLKKDEAQDWIEKLNEYAAANKPFLNPDLTLNQLAEALDITPRILSQIINEYFNQNFYDYINKLRIEESKKMLIDTASKKTVLEILYETGFNSKSTFNNIFKKMTGLTPTEFRRQNVKEHQAAD